MRPPVDAHGENCVNMGGCNQMDEFLSDGKFNLLLV